MGQARGNGLTRGHHHGEGAWVWAEEGVAFTRVQQGAVSYFLTTGRKFLTKTKLPHSRRGNILLPGKMGRPKFSHSSVRAEARADVS